MEKLLGAVDADPEPAATPGRGSLFTKAAVSSALPHCRARGDRRRTARDSLRPHEDRGDRGRPG